MLDANRVTAKRGSPIVGSEPQFQASFYSFFHGNRSECPAMPRPGRSGRDTERKRRPVGRLFRRVERPAPSGEPHKTANLYHSTELNAAKSGFYPQEQIETS